MKIQLPNRYKDKVYLVQQSEHKYLLEVPEKMADYVCCNYEGTWGTESCKICSVDPSGGPYICEGYKINEKEIVDKITLENNYYCIYTKNVND